MAFNPDIHHRRSIRLLQYDYSAAGAYFVTICVQGRECLFGRIENGEMRLNEAGEIVKAVWRCLPERFAPVEMDECIIMPNHFHGIICIVGAPLAAPRFAGAKGMELAKNRDLVNKQGAASSAPTLGSIMRVFKSISAIAVNRLLERHWQPLWQRNYYERVIRDEKELTDIREYILHNPMQWADDENNPDLRRGAARRAQGLNCFES